MTLDPRQGHDATPCQDEGARFVHHFNVLIGSRSVHVGRSLRVHGYLAAVMDLDSELLACRSGMRL